MTTKKSHIAFDDNALFAKSQLYISRGYKAFQAKDLEEYQLWAALALELLGKSTLAWVSPTLVADPQCVESLFAACGLSKSVDVKSITASTLIKRLGKLSKSFDHRAEKFCTSLTLRRNSEIHSGESPFSAMELKKWENQFWHAIEIMLRMQEKSLDDWLSPKDASEKKKLLHDVQAAREKAIAARIENCKKDFIEKFKGNPEEMKKVIENSKSQPSVTFSGRFSNSDAVENEECPACTGFALVGGVMWHEEVVDMDYDPYSDSPPIESVEATYSIEEFWCPYCGLKFDGVEEIAAAGVSSEFSRVSDREMEFEPDYGND